LVAVVALALTLQTANADDPRVCGNEELLRAMRIIDAACDTITCNFTTLKELNANVQKRQLLYALRDPYLQPVHVFFPMNETDVHRAFDWSTTKREQLATLQFIDDPEQSIIYVIGRASTTGDHDINVRMSRERMRSVMKYLQEELRVKCHNFHGGWLGREILQLNESDAEFLHIYPNDYRRDTYILNQSVEIFVYPCKKSL
jgi:hypothetical protein